MNQPKSSVRLFCFTQNKYDFEHCTSYPEGLPNEQVLHLGKFARFSNLTFCCFECHNNCCVFKVT